MPDYISLMREVRLVRFINKQSKQNGSSVPRKQNNKEVGDLKQIISQMMSKIPTGVKKSITQSATHVKQSVIHHAHMHLRDKLGFSEPGRNYLATITNPFDISHHSNKVPHGGGNTHSVTCKTPFEVIVGTVGTGFIACTPNVEGFAACLHNTATYSLSQASVTLALVSDATVTGKILNKPYTPAQVTSLTENAASWRLVSSGLRVTYNGSDQDRSGTFYSYNTPRNDSISTGVGIAALSGRNDLIGKHYLSDIEKGRPFEVTWHANSAGQNELCDILHTDSGFSPGQPSVMQENKTIFDPITGLPNRITGSSYGMVFEGLKPGITISAEIVEHWEFAGEIIGLLGTPVFSDSLAVNKAQSIATQVMTSCAKDSSMSRTEHTVQAIGNMVTSMEPQLIAGGAMLMGPQGAAGVAAGIEAFKRNEHGIVHGITSGIATLRHVFGIR